VFSNQRLDYRNWIWPCTSWCRYRAI